jgi:hypothetical protein
MNKFYTLFFLGFVLLSTPIMSQVTMSTGNATGVQLVPYAGSCFGPGTALQSACGLAVTFQFTDPQCCPCPTSGMICLPGSVGYGGPGSSGSFLNYHTLSYSPSNENQRLTFASKITKFQWSASGPNGPAEPFNIRVYDGVTLVGNFSFTVPGTGLRNTYHVSGPQFDRIDFIETNAISADDELFGDFMIATAGCPLPVENLNASLLEVGSSFVKIGWTTINESNIDRFHVQRSADGQNWERIGSEAPGTNDYSFTDTSPLNGKNLYRIECLDLGGESRFSNVLETAFSGQQVLKMIIYPNPAANFLNVDFPRNGEDTKTISLFDESGKLVTSTSSVDSITNFDISFLKNGTYFIRATKKGGLPVTRKLVVNR